VAYATGNAPMTGWLPPKLTYPLIESEIKRREVCDMTDFEMISVFLGIIGLLIAFGTMLIALLTFLDKDKKERK
jgi:amino acid permease